MSIELQYLVMTAVFTAVMWLPYVVNALAVRGLIEAVSYPECPKPMAPWAIRLKAAHYNAIENLTPFAALVLVAHAAGVSNAATVMCVQVYFWARVVHAVVYAAAIPWLRTLSFTVGWLAMLCIAAQLF